MGGISGHLADYTVFTSDNPRTENPETIIDEIEAGVHNGAAYERIESRAQAIRRVINMAQSGDVVIIAGKGHEPYQEIGTTRLPYDDRIEARKALEERFERQQQMRT
jgi:UDP-N-acetylmuramoyl-L-alanyl-D-glutamate--2,6-diaminopimelate ligase